MTMFTLPSFCRVCLKYDKNLIDLAHIENEPGETLMSKLQTCVAEVEWTTFKPLLCHPCIKRLNIAHSFKKQCIQSAGVLKNYVELVRKSQKKDESQTTTPTTVKTEAILPTTGGTLMFLPNQKYVKILVPQPSQGGGNTGNTFQNVFLNLIPATSLNSVVAPVSSTSITTTTANLKIPTSTTTFAAIEVKNDQKLSPDSGVNVNQLLDETKSEEVSVEIDPTMFGLDDEDDDDEDDNDNNDSAEEDDQLNDYDEVISSAKISLKDLKQNGEKLQNGNEDKTHFVPILPKQDDFSNSGQHFLFSSGDNLSKFPCESCQKGFNTKKLLKAHINQFHLGKIPFKCEYCYMEFYTRSEYELCRKTHNFDSNVPGKSITLQDLTPKELAEVVNLKQNDEGEFLCDVCNRLFTSGTGLLRHKVRKHQEKKRKKYFIKGMKNARCDICNRDFSTQSYLQLHRRLHMRENIGYKFKVFGKSKYDNVESTAKNSEEKIKNNKMVRKRKVFKVEESPVVVKKRNVRKTKLKPKEEIFEEIVIDNSHVVDENGSIIENC